MGSGAARGVVVDVVLLAAAGRVKNQTSKANKRSVSKKQRIRPHRMKKGVDAIKLPWPGPTYL